MRRTAQLFESYGWRDAAEVADHLRASLTEAGYSVWIDREHLRSDERHFAPALEQALEKSKIVIALLSPHSVRGLAEEDQDSSKCYNEIRVADFLKLPIVPVNVKEYEGLPPFLLIHRDTINWFDWQEKDAYQRGVGKILERIKLHLNGGKAYARDITPILDFSAELSTALGMFSGRDWLFPRLEDWLQSNRPCFMIKGMTGSGKTAIMAELVRRNHGQRILAYHFCSPTEEKVDPGKFVLSIAGMLANGIKGYGNMMRKGELSEPLGCGNPEKMLVEGVLTPLRRITMDGSFCIVVDGLDEAMAVPQARQSIPELLAGARKAFPPWLKLLVTTRPYSDIEGLFQAADQCVLGEATGDQLMDLEAYVKKRLAEPPLDQKINEHGRERAARLIADRSGGSFQYATMVLDALEQGEVTLGRLDELPKGLSELYFAFAKQRFPDKVGFDDRSRGLLGALLAAREPLTVQPLAALSGLAQPATALPLLDELGCFVDAAGPGGAGRTWSIAHSSIRDWLVSDGAYKFRIDPGGGRERLLEYCRQWPDNGEPYALKHVIAHLLEAGLAAEALQVVEAGLFKIREEKLKEPELDADDSRNLTLALVGTHDDGGIVKLARTDNIRQRDGVAAALQSAPEKDLGFINGVVGRLLKLSQ
ncbi:MAG: toll/interleukin-1 receptor domain-containing protein [Acetobacteraceae bacterium]